MTDEQIIERMKALYDDAELMHASVTYRTSGSDWRTIEVRDVSVMERSDDGLVVEIKDGGL